MSGWIAIVIVCLLAIPFAFFGMEQYLFQSNANFAAKVEAPPSWWRSAPDVWLVRKLAWASEEITTDDFRTAFEQERSQRRQTQGDSFDARAFESVDNKREVLESLIDEAVLRLAARSSGVAVGDALVRDTIQSIPAFQVDGRFSPERYQVTLQAQGQSPTQFQEMVREGLLQTIIPSQIAGSAFVTASESDRMLRLLEETRDVSLMLLPAPAPDTAAITAAEIQQWHAENAARYRVPEQVALEYVEIDGASVPAVAPPDEATLRERYTREGSRFSEPEQRLVSHILVPVEEDADAAAEKAAQDRAADIARQAKAAGADFAALAKANPGDPGSAANGGDLGWIRQDGGMVKPFEDAVFAADAGTVSDPVKSQFGWHVILVREVQAGRQVAFEEVRDQLAADLLQTERERAFNDAISGFVDVVYRNPTSLESAAEQAGLTVHTVGPFARGEGTGIAAQPAVVRAAFSESLIQDGTVSDPIEIGEQRTVMIRVTQHTPERAQTVAEARERIVADIRADRTAKQAEARADELLAQVKDSQTLQAVAAAEGLAVQALPGVPRGAPAPTAEASAAYFRVPAPAEGASSVGKVALEDGSYVLFSVDKVTPGDPSGSPAEMLRMFRSQFSQVLGQEDAQTLVQSLRKTMKITVLEDRL